MDDSTFVQIGDVLSLYSNDLNGFLQSDGISDSRCVLALVGGESAPKCYRDCLFRVRPMLQYSARVHLNEIDFADRSETDINDLITAAEKEDMLNEGTQF